MTIAELFVKIGIVSQTADLDKVEKQIKLAETSARKLALGVGLVDTAMIVLMKGMLGVVVGFTKFRVETGLSTEQLQRWQYAAKLSNVAAGDVTGAIMSIQDAQAAISLGEGNIAPWQLLGIDPRQDPIHVLDELADRIKNLDPGVARHITSQMGISNDMFFLLKQVSDGKMKLEDFNKIALVTPEQEEDMMRLNRQWQEFTYNIERGAMKLAVVLAPAFERLLPLATSLLEKGSKFAEWAVGGSEEAMKFRNAITYLAEGLLLLGPILASVVAGVGALRTILDAASLLKSVGLLTAGFLGWAAVIAIAAADIAMLIKLMNIMADIKKATIIGAQSGVEADASEKRLGQLMHEKGYKPTTDREKQIYEAQNPVALALENEGHKNFFDLSQEPVPKRLPAAAHGAIVPPVVARQAAAQAKQEARAQASESKPPVNITHNVTIQIDGSKEPSLTAKEVRKEIEAAKRNEYSGVSDQMAVPGQGY